jgi:hypothetical protein
VTRSANIRVRFFAEINPQADQNVRAPKNLRSALGLRYCGFRFAIIFILPIRAIIDNSRFCVTNPEVGAERTLLPPAENSGPVSWTVMIVNVPEFGTLVDGR